MCITPSDETVEKSSNKYWGMLGLWCWSFYYTDSTCNVGYWHFVYIVNSGPPIWSIARYLWSCIIRNTIITDIGEYRYGSCWMFVDVIIHSLNHHIMMVVYWAGYYHFVLRKSMGKYYFSNYLQYHYIIRFNE